MSRAADEWEEDEFGAAEEKTGMSLSGGQRAAAVTWSWAVRGF